MKYLRRELCGPGPAAPMPRYGIIVWNPHDPGAQDRAVELIRKELGSYRATAINYYIAFDGAGGHTWKLYWSNETTLPTPRRPQALPTPSADGTPDD